MFINVKSNICCDVYKMAYESTIASMLFSEVPVLQKLFGQFHIHRYHQCDEVKKYEKNTLHIYEWPKK